VSAMSGETNRLQGLANEVDDIPSARELDVLLSAGEQVTIALLAMMINKLGHKAISLTGWQAGIVTDDAHNQATISSVDRDKIYDLLNDDQIVVIAGFQGINQVGAITTLGRGGSDTSAVTLAGLLGANECQIFTDVDGVYTCDPRVVPTAIKIDEIDFFDMQIMARHGAKVLHLPCVDFAAKHNLNIRVLSSFSPKDGTLVTNLSSKKAVCGLALQRDLARIKFISENTDKVALQCQLLGITIHLKEISFLVINANDVSKLLQVLHEKVDSIEQICALTLVGSQVSEFYAQAKTRLTSENVKVIESFKCEGGVRFLLLPEQVESAATIIHSTYIEQLHNLPINKKQLIL